MSRSSQATGFDIRRAAAQRLQTVLTGAPFIPFGGKDIADARDRALANKLVTVSLRRHGQISHILSSVLEKGMPKRAGLFEPALRIGIAQLLFLPDMGEHSAIHLAVEVIKKDRRAGRFAKLANAALRNVQRGFSIDDLDDKDLVPDWMYRRWVKHHGEAAADKMLVALLETASLDLTFKSGEAAIAVAKDLGAEQSFGTSYRLVSRETSVEELAGYQDGLWWVQDFAASLPVQLADCKEGMDALDICAAPGGKTIQMAALGANVTAVDFDGKRLVRVKENLERLDMEATLVEADATKLSAEKQYDLVLLDAPCSATGTMRRHPEVIWHRKEKDFTQRSKLQSDMLKNTAHLVKPGGQIVFCTCSLEPEEGEVQAKDFLNKHQEFELEEITADELNGWKDGVYTNGYLRTLPGMNVPNNEGTLDGFFVARFRRKK